LKRGTNASRQSRPHFILSTLDSSTAKEGIATLTQSTGFTTPTVTQALGELQKLGIVRETTGRARGRIFA
jgi:Fic family protein